MKTMGFDNWKKKLRIKTADQTAHQRGYNPVFKLSAESPHLKMTNTTERGTDRHREQIT